MFFFVEKESEFIARDELKICLEKNQSLQVHVGVLQWVSVSGGTIVSGGGGVIFNLGVWLMNIVLKATTAHACMPTCNYV